MNLDYKHEIMEMAEQAAEDQFSKEFYSLSADEQHRLYHRATQDWHDQQSDRAERLRDLAREG